MNISIIEFAVYAFVGYSSLLMLIISITKEGPMVKSRTGTLAKSIYIIPGIICMILLSGSGVDIYLEDSLTSTNNTSIYEVLDNTNAVVTLNSTVTETVSTSSKFVLQNPIWITMHYMFALIMFAYVIINTLKMLSAKD